MNIQKSLPVLFWRNDIQAFTLTMVELVLNDYHFIGWCGHRMCALTDLSGHTCLEACRKCRLLVRVKCYWHHRKRATCQNKWAAFSLTSFLWIEKPDATISNIYLKICQARHLMGKEAFRNITIVFLSFPGYEHLPLREMNEVYSTFLKGTHPISHN